MDFMIFLKWSSDWSTYNNQPSIITLMINLPLKGADPGEVPLWGDGTIVSIICILIMLIPKPLLIYYDQKRKYKKVNKRGSRNQMQLQQQLRAFQQMNLLNANIDQVNNDHKDEHSDEEKDIEIQVHSNPQKDILQESEHKEEESLGELFIHQIIETIEFALGSISNTASYLRLWALSLAHEQLAEVFFEKGIKSSIENGDIVGLFFGFLIFAIATFGVLMCMDIMECFLHTLRLHWDLFNKFIKISDNNYNQPPPKNLQDNINQLFDQDKDKFIGEFVCDDYVIIRGYINGTGKQLRLYYTKLEPKQGKKATICIVHGFGEHSGRFLHIADRFAKVGFVVQLVDLRGFGYSGGPRGASTIEELHQDICTLLKQANKDLPLYLYGHSLGGQLVITLVMRNPLLNIAGVIITSALIGFPKDRKINFLKTFLLKSLGKKLEDIVVNSMIHPTALTKNDEYIKKCFGDRLMIPFLGMNMAKNILEGIEYVIPNAFKFQFPCIIIHGQKDMVTNHHDSIAFYNKCSRFFFLFFLYFFNINEISIDKTLKLFENGYHELQHDDEFEELIECIICWINQRYTNAKNFGLIGQIKCGLKRYNKKSRKYKFALFFLILIYIYYLYKFRQHSLFGKQQKKILLSPFLNL
ncbi:hypothetical protein IMG5_120760, partial [Ichthyophthirius multifiliis]